MQRALHGAGEIRFAALSRAVVAFFRSVPYLAAVKKKGELEPGNFRGSGVQRERGLLLSRQAALRKYDGGDTQFRGFMKIRGVMRDHNVTRGRKFSFTFVKKHERKRRPRPAKLR